MVNAAAGAQRVFELMDQEPEKDEGYVELVNAEEDENGNLIDPRCGPISGRGNIRIRRRAPLHTADWKAALYWMMSISDITKTRLVLHNIKSLCKTGTEDCVCRRDGCRKNDDYKPDQPVLRYCGRENPV